jgi:hypothetical protein
MGIGFVDFAGLSPPVRWRSSRFGEVAEIAILIEAASWTDRPPAWNAVDPADLRARAEH